MALGQIKKLQAKKFKENYMSEIDIAVSYIKSSIKSDESISPEDVQEAKNIICENLDKIVELEGYDTSVSAEPYSEY